MQKLSSLIGLSKNSLKILFIASEEAPFAKVGGLGEVMFSLPRALRRQGHDARVFMPLYGTIDQKEYKLPYIKKNLDVPTAPDSGGKGLTCNVRYFATSRAERDPVMTYFLENQEYFELRSNVYGYIDDRIRFALLCRGCLEFLAGHGDWTPDVIVCSDWMTGYLPSFLENEYRHVPRLSKIATVFSIHNLAMQGLDKPERYILETERDNGMGPIPDILSSQMKTINAVKRGIIWSDMINTVSQTYAEEITTEEFGAGLDKLLAERREKLRGILNGIDYETNNPATDRQIAAAFDARNTGARLKNKTALQRKMNLDESPDKFVIGIVSRLTRQKGFDLLKPVIEVFLNITGSQLVTTGSGDTELMDFFKELEKKFPKQVSVYLQFSEELPHMIYAGCDALLIPSRFEPSGLTQMEAMRYGAVPVARRTGGLADTIEDYEPGKGKGTGFLFEKSDPLEFLIALTRAYSSWRHRSEWSALEKRVMHKDFSWHRSAREYTSLFRAAIAARRATAAKREKKSR